MESLKELTKEICFFEDVEEKCPEYGSERPQEILQDVFQDLLDYLIGVTRIFFRSNGRKLQADHFSFHHVDARK